MKVNFFTNTYVHNTNFSGRDEVRRKVDAFSDDLIKEASSGDMPIEKVQQITTKYLPKIKIQPLSPNSKKYKDNGGMYHSNISFHIKPPSAEITGRIFKLKRMCSDRDYTEYLATIAHEMTHAFQSADEDLRDDKLITSSLQGLPIEKWGEQMDIGYQGFVKIENEMLKSIILEHRETKFKNNGIHFLDSHVNREKFKKALNAKLKEIKEENPSANMDFVKKLLYLEAMDEFDAYTTDENFKKKLDPNYETDDFIPYLYLCLADCLEVEGVE